MIVYLDPEAELRALTHILATYLKQARLDPKNIAEWKHLAETASSAGRKRRISSEKITQIVTSEILGISTRTYSALEKGHRLCTLIVFFRFIGKLCDEDTVLDMYRKIRALYQDVPLEQEI